MTAPSSSHVAPWSELSTQSRQAIARSVLGELPDALLRRVLGRAHERTYAVGMVAMNYGNGVVGPPLGLVLAGRIRLSLLSSNGRELALQYAGPGSLLGVASLVYADGAPCRPLVPDARSLEPATRAEVTHPVRMLVLSPDIVRETARHEPALSWTLAKAITQQAVSSSELVAANVFTPIRSRVARHLLKLATREGSDHVLDVSQQEIADAIGSVREVVARTLSALVAEGTLARRGKRLVVLDPRRLHQLAEAS
jgi:CRP-like cAMP-binding protein